MDSVVSRWGVGWIDSKRCYQAGKTEAIGPIGDALDTASFELQKKARAFAQKYNQLLVKFFVENGMRQCPLGESWDAAQSMLNDYLRSIGGSNKDGIDRNGVGGIIYPAEKGYDFDVNIEAFSMTKTVYRKICSVISHDLASTLVSINISNASPPHQDTGQLYCQAGKLLSFLPLQEQ